MTKEITYCDRCGKEVEYPIVRGIRIEQKDLCQECQNSLQKWWKAPYKAEKE